MGKTWEIDFYSRPIVDDNGKKIWEILVCESPNNIQSSENLFQYAQYCSSTEVNSVALKTALEKAIDLAGESPQKIRFFRRQMNNMITKACQDLGIPATASRRTFVLEKWIEERMIKVYTEHPNYQPVNKPAIINYDSMTPKALPDALIGNKWAFVSLEKSAFDDFSEWPIDFGEVFPLNMTEIIDNTIIPGLIIYSERALPMAAWMSGIEPVFISVEKTNPPRLLLDTGSNDSWILIKGLDQKTQKSALDFETAKKNAHGLHFLAIQSNPNIESFAGFWLLLENV